MRLQNNRNQQIEINNGLTQKQFRNYKHIASRNDMRKYLKNSILNNFQGFQQTDISVPFRRESKLPFIE